MKDTSKLHTPGPWSARPNSELKRRGWYSHEVVAPAHGRLPARRVALTDSRGMDPIQAEANARLIAAGPGILAALCALLVDLAAQARGEPAPDLQRHIDAATELATRIVGPR